MGWTEQEYRAQRHEFVEAVAYELEQEAKELRKANR